MNNHNRIPVHSFDPAGKEVTFIGSNDPRTPVAEERLFEGRFGRIRDIDINRRY